MADGWTSTNKRSHVKKSFKRMILSSFGIMIVIVGIFFSQVSAQEGNIEQLIQELQDNNQNIRARAAQKLIVLGKPSINPLITALINEGQDTQQIVAWILAKIGEPAIPPLIEVLTQVSFGTQGRLASNAVRSSIKMHAFQALVMIGSPAVEALLPLITHEDMQVRLLTVNALGQSGDSRATAALFQALEDQAALIRIDATKGLDRIGITTSEPILPLLQNSEPFVRKWAAEKLGQIGDSRAIEPLSLSLSDKDRSVRRSAVNALARLGKPGITALIEALNNDDQFVRQGAAIAALGELRDVRAIEPLIVTLNDKSRMVTVQVEEALLTRQ